MKFDNSITKKNASISCEECGYTVLVPDGITLINNPNWSGGYAWDERIHSIVDYHNDEKHKDNPSAFNIRIV